MFECRIINALAPDDLSALRKLYIESGWITPDDPANFLPEVLERSAVAVGAFNDGSLIGFGRALSDNCSDAYIQDVVVDPKFRGQGIGSRIIRFLEAELRRRGVDWIALVGEPGTEKFYSGLGLKAEPEYTLWRFPDEKI